MDAFMAGLVLLAVCSAGAGAAVAVAMVWLLGGRRQPMNTWNSWVDNAERRVVEANRLARNRITADLQARVRGRYQDPYAQPPQAWR